MVLNGGKRLSLFWMSFCTAYISHQIVGALYGLLLIAYTVRSPLFSVVVWTETYIIGCTAESRAAGSTWKIIVYRPVKQWQRHRHITLCIAPQAAYHNYRLSYRLRLQTELA